MMYPRMVYLDRVFADLIACPELLAAFGTVGLPRPKFWAGSIMSKVRALPPLWTGGWNG